MLTNPLFRWSYGLFRFASYFLKHGTYVGCWPEISPSLSFFQTLQLIEVLHNIIGLVPSSAFTTFMQILSRLVVVWGILDAVPESRLSLGLPLLMSAWSVAEITRYAYYGLNLINLVPYPLLWARYTFFTFLYPIGVTGELLAIYSALPYLQSRGIYSYALPNKLNISFHFYIVVILICLGYVPCKS